MTPKSAEEVAREDLTWKARCQEEVAGRRTAEKERDALAEKVGRMRKALQTALATMHEHDNGHCTECGGYPNEHLRDCSLPMLRAALADDGEKK